MKRDPMPLDQMPPKERAAYVRKLREEMSPPDPNDESIENLPLEGAPL